MIVTRGQLKAARIVEVTVDENGKVVREGRSAPCMFNPYEYTVSKANQFDEQKLAKTANSPKAELSKAGAQTLKLNLTFDTSDEKNEQDKNVSLKTNELWDFMKLKNVPAPNSQDKGELPLVAFHWGVFYFISYITSMTQRFTLFTKDGTPTRAKVEVQFTQYIDVNDYPKQNPTSGGGPINRTWRVVAGDRLDLIATEVYKDATQWRKIAEYNQLLDPLALRPGQMLLIPFEHV